MPGRISLSFDMEFELLGVQLVIGTPPLETQLLRVGSTPDNQKLTSQNYRTTELENG